MRKMQLYKWIENPWVIGGVLFFLNLFVKGYFLQSQSLASDEAFTIFHAQLPVKELIGRISTGITLLYLNFFCTIGFIYLETVNG